MAAEWMSHSIVRRWLTFSPWQLEANKNIRCEATGKTLSENHGEWLLMRVNSSGVELYSLEQFPERLCLAEMIQLGLHFGCKIETLPAALVKTSLALP